MKNWENKITSTYIRFMHLSVLCISFNICRMFSKYCRTVLIVSSVLTLLMIFYPSLEGNDMLITRNFFRILKIFSTLKQHKGYFSVCNRFSVVVLRFAKSKNFFVVPEYFSEISNCRMVNSLTNMIYHFIFIKSYFELNILWYLFLTILFISLTKRA